MARYPLSPYRSADLLGSGLEDVFSLQRNIDRLFDQMLGGSSQPAGSATSGILTARMNVSETEGEIRITAELPGVAEGDIDISLNNDLLTIRGEKKFEKSNDRENFHFMERSYGTFQRSLRLPFPVDPAAVTARFDSGVLTVTVPKTEAEKRTRRIELQRGSSQPAVEHQPSSNGQKETGAQTDGSSSGRPGDKGGEATSARS